MIIQHRVNQSFLLQSIPREYGIEVDLRSSGNEIICSHDPFNEAENFNDWIKQFAHRFLILNIKSEGIEEKILNTLGREKISNFFLLDVSFPFMCKLKDLGVNKFAYRVSDLEPLNLDILNYLGSAWIWLDAFKLFPANYVSKLNALKKENIKICLVSPELHASRDLEISDNIMKQIKSSNLEFDAVCTKEPLQWK